MLLILVLVDASQAMADLMKKETGKLEKIGKLLKKLSDLHKPLGE